MGDLSEFSENQEYTENSVIPEPSNLYINKVGSAGLRPSAVTHAPYPHFLASMYIEKNETLFYLFAMIPVLY